MEYTEQQLEDAKEYLRRRIDGELSMERDIEGVIGEYAPLLVSLMLRFGVTGNAYVEVLVHEMIERIISDCYILGVDDRLEREDAIRAYINSKRGDGTMESRVRERCRTFAEEVGAVVAVGVVLKRSRDHILQSIRENLTHPYDNEILQEARELEKSGRAIFEVKITPPSMGKGVAVSSMTALQTITSYAVADAWMWDLFQVNKDAKGYFVFRGSSYPCEQCDDAVAGGFHPMDDWEHFVPLHPHCRCGVIFV